MINTCKKSSLGDLILVLRRNILESLKKGGFEHDLTFSQVEVDVKGKLKLFAWRQINVVVLADLKPADYGRVTHIELEFPCWSGFHEALIFWNRRIVLSSQADVLSVR